MGSTTPVVKGYYKYTDIFFEWHKELPDPESVSPLRAMLSSNALVHPGHPLRKPGQDGIELYIVTRKSNGQQRLAFSSKQIEYIQYWLHAMGLTKERIPIPHSEYLIPEDDIEPVSEVVYKTVKDLKKANKDVEKFNKRLKGSDSSQQDRMIQFENARRCMQSRKGTWLAIDFEDWEVDHNKILEFGYSLIRWENGKLREERGHWIVEEHRQFRNGRYIADKRDNYDFGKSEFVPKKNFKERINAMIDDYLAQGPLYLVFHDAGGDLKTLRSRMIEAPLPDLQHTLPGTAPTKGLFVVDTQKLFTALHGDDRQLKLRSVLILLHVHFQRDVPSQALDNLHNAGNDAHLTMLALRSMAEGETLEYQRKTRWEEKVSTTKSAVNFTPWDDVDAFYEDDGTVSDTPLDDENVPADDREWPE